MSRGLALAIGIPIALVLLCLTGSIVAWFVLGLPASAYDPLKMPAFFWYYRGDPVVLKALGAGLAAGSLLSGLLLFWFVTRKPPLHGAARFAKEGEIRRNGFRGDEGIVLGKKAGRFLIFEGN